MIFPGPIFLHDFNKPLRARAETRKHAGPYQWTPPAAPSDRGFYFDSKGRMATCMTLRVEEAPAEGRNRVTYYVDELCDMLILPFVFRLPHARGFLAGCGEGAGMWGFVTRAIWETAAEASSAAHHEAEQAAERERSEPEDYEGDSYTAHPEAVDINAPCHCDDCDWRGPFRKLRPIGEAYLTPGDPSPAGRCPECETLAYINDGSEA